MKRLTLIFLLSAIQVAHLSRVYFNCDLKEGDKILVQGRVKPPTGRTRLLLSIKPPNTTPLLFHLKPGDGFRKRRASYTIVVSANETPQGKNIEVEFVLGAGNLLTGYINGKKIGTAPDFTTQPEYIETNDDVVDTSLIMVPSCPPKQEEFIWIG